MDNNMLFIPNQKRKKHSYFRTSDVIFLLIVTCVVTLNMSYMISLTSEKKSVSVDGERSTHLNEFIDEYNRIVDHYYGDLDEGELIDAALNGLIEALPDDYSATLDKSESNNYDTKLQGQYEGLGVEIVNDTEKNDIYINKIIENSPAEKADLKAGDKIISVNGTNVEGQSTNIFVNLVKNSKNKKFEIVVERDGKKITTTISKGRIVLQSVFSEVINVDNKNIGYMSVSVFAANTYEQFRDQLTTVEGSDISGLVIDLRGNGGGYLSTVTDMLSLFIDKSDVLYQTEQNGKKEKIYSTKPGKKVYDIVVLIDGGSASASEIMAAALKEQCNATLVGKKSYGKGTVQELITLSDGVKYKYTTKKWLTPKGVWIDGKGLTPDYEVSLDQSYIQNPSKETDAQYQKALEIFKNN